jgi:hypothetical protein
LTVSCLLVRESTAELFWLPPKIGTKVTPFSFESQLLNYPITRCQAVNSSLSVFTLRVSAEVDAYQLVAYLFSSFFYLFPSSTFFSPPNTLYEPQHQNSLTMERTADTPGSEATFDNFSMVSLGDSVANQKTRVVVVFGSTFFPGEKRIIIPAAPSVTVSDFLAEAVRRAQTLGLTISPTADLVLHTDSEHGPIAFGEDSLRDILDTMENIVWIQYAEVSGPFPLYRSFEMMQ